MRYRSFGDAYNKLAFLFLGIELVETIIQQITEPEGIGLQLLILMCIGELGLSIWLAAKGNELTAKNLLAKGWEFEQPESTEANIAVRAWSLRQEVRRTNQIDQPEAGQVELSTLKPQPELEAGVTNPPLKKYLAFAVALALVGGVVIWFAVATQEAPNLKAYYSATGGLFGEAAFSLQNTGDEPIKIISVQVNGRKECFSVGAGDFLARNNLPIVLKSGDKWLGMPSCNVVKLEVEYR